MNVRKLYGRYRARLHDLSDSRLPEDAFRKAVLEVAGDLNADLTLLGNEDRKALCDDLGTQLETELYRATNRRQKRILVALLKVIDSQK